MILDMDYIAGLMDADGSFNISISRNRYVNKSGLSEPQFSFVVNFRQLERARSVLESIQETLGVGKIYNHRHNGTQLMLTWQTTAAKDTKTAAELLEPYLIIKKNDCKLLLEAVDLWLNSPRSSKGGRPGVGDEIKQRIMGISSVMNDTQQKITSRRNKEIRNIPGPLYDLSNEEHTMARKISEKITKQ